MKRMGFRVRKGKKEEEEWEQREGRQRCERGSDKGIVKEEKQT